MEKYNFLGYVILGMKILSFIIAAVTVISFFAILIMGGDPGSPRYMSLVALVLGFLYFGVIYIFAGIAELLLDIKDNTKKEEL
ncbi:MAG: hypothetical protein ACQESB_05420 [Elusimicrobiota bacterium]